MFNPEDLRICVSLEENFADATARHTIFNYNAVISPLSGAYFNNAYLQSDNYITFPEKFSLSFAIYPEGVNSTDSTLLISRDSNNIDWHVYLKPNGQIRWTSHSGGSGLETVNATVNYNEWNHIHITGDTSINKRHIYINGVEGYCCATWANTTAIVLPQPPPAAGTVLSIGQDPEVGTTTAFKGYMSDVAFIAGQATYPSTCHICPRVPPPLIEPSNVQVVITDYPLASGILRSPYDVGVNVTQDSIFTGLYMPDEVDVQITY